MSGERRADRIRGRSRWLAGRTLSARLIAGVLLLLLGACAVIGVVTYLAVRDSMVSTVDQQLRSASATYAICIESNHQDSTGPQGGPYQPGEQGDNPPPPNSNFCSQGQPQGMLGVRIKDGEITNCGVVNGMNNATCHLSAADTKALMALPVYQQSAHQQPPWPSSTTNANLTSLAEDYRLTAVEGHDGDILITGLPLSSVEHTLGQVAITELIVFLSVLLLAGVLGTALVQFSLRPLRRVAATATKVTELPLDSGEVTLPAGVPDTDPRTEVGQVGAAFNRMLLHVERALGRRAASEARLRRFAADASHELRTPLSAIRGYAELALRHHGPVPEDVTHALTRVQSESARMSVLVDDLLLLARLDAGRPLEREPVDLSRLAIDVTSDARVARREHHWRLDLPSDPVLVRGDEHRLHQVLANLMSNAGKHTPPGSTISVALHIQASPGIDAQVAPDGGILERGTRPAAPRVELSITDDGPGIPPELLPELFERFTRADTSRARDLDATGKSTGLGLAIVDAVVAAHGGSITVTSQPGRTRFAIYLPLLPEPADMADIPG
ncbi:MAG TPA: HAMP domain-containing sensor histidine kinase [Streptosporangiaceae bacterium]|nr:HAMP domain-containing sensor histidine kinase [Streptosporangiaceae bacterium]